MPCDRVDLPGGVSAIVCSRGSRRSKPCAHCGSTSYLLCDFPVLRAGRRTTCDAPLCHRCTTRHAGDVDLCRPHAERWSNGKPTVGPGAEIEIPDVFADEP